MSAVHPVDAPLDYEERPRLIVNRDAQTVIDEAWRILLSLPDFDRPYQQDRRLIRVTESGRMNPCGPAEIRAMLYKAARLVRVVKVKKDGAWEEVETPSPCPPWLDRAMAAIPAATVPELRAVAHAPFLSTTGRIIYGRGYHASDRTLLLMDGEKIPRMTIQEAHDLVNDWLIDYRFQAKSDALNALALWLLPFVRPAISGPTPAHVVEASAPGSGKGLLAAMLVRPGTGSLPPLSPFSDAEEERRKQIVSLLAGGRSAIILDNLKGKVDSPTLEAVLTSTTWADRMLGTMGEVTIQNRAAWVMTANNLELSLDLARRTLRIRLDPGVERPYERTGFIHENPKWTEDTTPALIGAACALIQDWLDQGRPVPEKLLGSYEEWSRIVGGILTSTLDGTAWLQDRDDLYRNADRTGDEWREVIERWGERHGTARVVASRIIMIANEFGLVQGTIGDGGERSQATRFGAALARQRGRIYGRWRVGAGVRTNEGMAYALEAV